MPNPFRRSVSFPLRCSAAFQSGPLVPALLFCLLSLTAGRAIAQSPATPPTGLEKQFSRIDLSVSGAGFFSTSVTGTNYTGVTFTQRPSTTVTELATLRYVAKPYVGFEFNFGNLRYTQNFITQSFTNSSVCPNTSCTYVPGGAQNNVHELTLGYVAHPHSFFGLDPFVGAGGGTMQFRPTPGGGQGLPRQFRAVYFYDAGVDDYFPTTHLGIRVAFRQLIYLAPDFGQNYLTITRRTATSEPTIGFFLRF
jgi:hypothetical protein